MTIEAVIIDDDQDDIGFLTDAINETFGDSQYTIRLFSFSSPTDALQYFEKSNSPDPTHIFIDLNMPSMNGLECIAQIRQRRSLDTTLITLISTFIPPEVQANPSKFGLDYAVEKPIVLSRYHDLVESIFLKRSLPLFS